MDGTTPSLPLVLQGRNKRMDQHLPVMLQEALTALDINESSVRSHRLIVDGTFGRGGHSAAILDALQGNGVLHAIDQDPEAEAEAQRRFGGRADFVFHRANFSQLRTVASGSGFAGRIDGLLLDLGVSSPQFDNAERGFSFSHDGPLDMRMNPHAGQSAAQWLAEAEAEEIAEVLFTYGEERNSRRIAQRIVQVRADEPILRTGALAALIASVPGPRSKNIHPATRSFQAIRIFINGELDALNAVLGDALQLLAADGRLAVISFHSLEDRIVKQFLREQGGARRDAKNKYAQHSQIAASDVAALPKQARLVEVGRYFPSDAECARNPRARSAVLRVAQKLAADA